MNWWWLYNYLSLGALWTLLVLKLAIAKKKKKSVSPKFFLYLISFRSSAVQIGTQLWQIIKNTETFFQKMKKNLSIMFNGTDNWNTLSIATLKIRVVNFWNNIQHYKLDVYIVHLYTRGNRLCTLKSVESTLSVNVRVVTLHHPTINVHRKFRSALDPLESSHYYKKNKTCIFMCLLTSLATQVSSLISCCINALIPKRRLMDQKVQ